MGYKVGGLLIQVDIQDAKIRELKKLQPTNIKIDNLLSCRAMLSEA